MAALSLSLCGVGVRSHNPPFLSLKLTPKLSLITPNFRFKNSVRLQIRQSSFSAFASNSNPSGGGDPLPEILKPTNGTGQGPPFLTILAGLLVFLLFCWMLGSLVSWLVRLIF